ncbi:hypothetical protein BgiMline_030783, partial [Biomphalaria glabrata]
IMTSLAIYLLPAILLAVFHAAAHAEDGTGPLSRHNALRTLLRKRSLEAALRAPPSLYSELLDSPLKRDSNGGDYWIWMPAHGYMPVPNDEVTEQQGGQEKMGTLLRYG